MSCYALLDDASASEARSRLYTGHVDTLTCIDAAQLPALLEKLRQALAQGRHALALFDYELGAQLHGIAARPGEDSDAPLARVLLFDDCRHLQVHEAEAWLAQQTGPEERQAGIAGLQASNDRARFDDAIARIHAWLEAGDTYQVNYTWRLHFDAYGTPAALYRRLRAIQPVPYGALVQLPDGGAVLSFSPELFVRNDGGELTARPMKGTAPAAGDDTQDQARAQALAADEKNRAENLMIVDLLRNDLGRIARPGTVRVPRLFEVSRYGQVLQMTSTVQARLRDDVTLAQLLQALFPCGSITGAPKHRTMQIIRELEPDARALYTGALGWFDAPARDAQEGIGDFCLSVPIRTLLLQPMQHGVRRGVMGVGAGIVHDSDAEAEFRECQLKARFLTGLRQDFELLETMRADSTGCAHLERHLQRLQASAAYFGFIWDEVQLRARLQQACAQLPAGEYRLRLALRQEGGIDIRTAPLAPLAQPVRLLLAPHPVQADDLFLRHKTSVRQRYDDAWREAEAQGAFDMLFHNEAGELTEGARSNLFLRLGGRWLTPPVAAGLLPGVMRAVLLEDPAWQASEARLTLADLHKAEAIVVCNALRGPLHARLA